MHANIVELLAGATTFYGVRGFAGHRSGCGQIGKMRMPLEPRGIFGSIIAKLFILKLPGNHKVPARSGSCHSVPVS